MTSPLTAQQLDDIETRANAATPGPWRDHEDWPGRVFAESEFNAHVARVTGSNPEPNEKFIAAARTDVPALLAEVRRLTAELAQAQENYQAYRIGAEGAKQILATRVAALEQDSALLGALHAAGVDNWDGYDDAREHLPA